MNPNELRETASELEGARITFAPESDGSEKWNATVMAGADAARRLADVIEYAERHEHLDGVLLGDVLRIARGES